MSRRTLVRLLVAISVGLLFGVLTTLVAPIGLTSGVASAAQPELVYCTNDQMRIHVIQADGSGAAVPDTLTDDVRSASLAAIGRANAWIVTRNDT